MKPNMDKKSEEETLEKALLDAEKRSKKRDKKLEQAMKKLAALEGDTPAPAAVEAKPKQKKGDDKKLRWRDALENEGQTKSAQPEEEPEAPSIPDTISSPEPAPDAADLMDKALKNIKEKTGAVEEPEESIPADPASTTRENWKSVVLDDARAKYAEAYKEFMADRKKGFMGKLKQAKELIFGGTVHDKNIPPELKKLEEEYDTAAVALGNEMLANGASKAEIFKRIVLQEQEMLAKEKAENLPAKERGILGKSLDWYIRQPKWKKIAIATALSTAVFAVAAPGTVAAAGGVATFAGIRLARGVAGSTAGQLAAKSIDWLFKEKSTEKRIEEEEDLSKLFESDFATYNNTNDAKYFKYIKDQHTESLEVEKMRKRARILAKAGVGILAGGVASLGTGFGAGRALDGATSTSTSGVKPSASPTPTPSPSTTPSDSPTLTPSPSPIESPSPSPSPTPARAPIDSAPAAPTAPSAPQIEKPIDAAIVQKGEGIEHAFIRQIETNPKLAQDLGFKGDINDIKALHKFAQIEAHKITLKTGYGDHAGEIRVSKGNEVAYELKMENGKISVQEKALDGRVIETHNEGDKFGEGVNDYEYEEGKKIVEEPQRVRKVTHSVDKVDNIKAPAHSPAIQEPEIKTRIEKNVPENDAVKTDNTITTGTTVRVGETIEVGSTIKTGTEIKTGVIGAEPKPNASPTPDPTPIPKPSPTPEEIKTKLESQMDLAGRHPELVGTPFAKNTFSLPDDKLVEVSKVYQKNIEYISKEDAGESWSYIKESRAVGILEEIKGDSAKGDKLADFLNRLREVTGENPRGSAIEGYETVDQYVARAMQKAAQLGRLDKVKF